MCKGLTKFFTSFVHEACVIANKVNQMPLCAQKRPDFCLWANLKWKLMRNSLKLVYWSWFENFAVHWDKKRVLVQKKSNLLLKIIFYNTWTLELFTINKNKMLTYKKMIKTVLSSLMNHDWLKKSWLNPN